MVDLNWNSDRNSFDGRSKLFDYAHRIAPTEAIIFEVCKAANPIVASLGYSKWLRISEQSLS